MSRGPRIDPHEYLVHQAIQLLNREPETRVWKNTSAGDVRIIGLKGKQFVTGVVHRVREQMGITLLIKSGDGERGLSDIVGIGPGGVYLAFEAKSGRSATPNSQLKPEQRRHRDDVLAAGGFYCAYGEPSEAVALYRNWLQERT